MRSIILLILLETGITTASTTFELETRFNDKDLFNEFTLGSPSMYGQPYECADHCTRNPQCSMFSFNQGTERCQLYGDVVYSGESSAPGLTGERYFVVRTEWCPLKNYFFMFRAANMCVHYPKKKYNFADARSWCMVLGARLTSLEEEKRATAVINLLGKMGLDTTSFYAGADDQAKEGEFVWGDGRKMDRPWWEPGQPEGTAEEDCVFLFNGGLRDNTCNYLRDFFCEISQ